MKDLLFIVENQCQRTQLCYIQYFVLYSNGSHFHKSLTASPLRVAFIILCRILIIASSRKLKLALKYDCEAALPSGKDKNCLLHCCLVLLSLDFPNGDLAVTPCWAAQNVAILSWAECLDAVWMSLKFFCHSVALWIHHQHLTPQLTVPMTSNTTPATTAHPNLWGGQSRQAEADKGWLW